MSDEYNTYHVGEDMREREQGEMAISEQKEILPEHVRGMVLNEALTVINGERQDSYGNPEDSHSLIAALWGAYLGVTITAREAAEMMVLFKVARMRGQKPHMDNYRDAAGYLGIAADMLPKDGAP